MMRRCRAARRTSNLSWRRYLWLGLQNMPGIVLHTALVRFGVVASKLRRLGCPCCTRLLYRIYRLERLLGRACSEETLTDKPSLTRRFQNGFHFSRRRKARIFITLTVCLCECLLCICPPDDAVIIIFLSPLSAFDSGLSSQPDDFCTLLLAQRSNSLSA
ncbi:hypothetical protein DFH11DRAFT_680045 [Phellopilus nigrolimitatus]|nr:hypothetical protein DFH11DRAFT_680045 [Phellopilus nigrolimitatus]